MTNSRKKVVTAASANRACRNAYKLGYEAGLSAGLRRKRK